MKLTIAFKKWLVENCDVTKDASDDDYRKAAAEALASGKLAADKFAELTKDPDEGQANEFGNKLDKLTDSFDKLTEILVKANTPVEKPEKTESTPEPEKKTEPEVKKVGAAPDISQGGTPESTDVKDEGNVRTKGAWEGYDTKTTALAYPDTDKRGNKHSLAGRPVMDYSAEGGGRALEQTSQLQRAINGAWSKFQCSRARRGGSKTLGFQMLPDHDKELILYAIKNCLWNGSTLGDDNGDIKARRLTELEGKALIDDGGASGALEAAPIFFDADVIQTPLLFGELFPNVNRVPIDRGRRIEGVQTLTVTGGWGGVDGSAIALFNTAGYIAAFDTTIYRWQGSIQIGLDFLSDTPIDFGAHVTRQYGERLLEDLDDVIAAGNGTTQPEGIINKGTATSVNWGGNTNLGNYESLRFGVAKPEHKGTFGSSAVFCGTETSYQRARAIPVGAADARRLGGMDYSSYRWMERDFRINEALTNQQVFYAILARYRMYVRRGLTIRTSTEGETLIRANELLIAVTARYGGQLERGGAAAITTTAPV